MRRILDLWPPFLFNSIRVRELAAGPHEHHVKDHKTVGVEPAQPVLILDPRNQQAVESLRRKCLAHPRLRVNIGDRRRCDLSPMRRRPAEGWRGVREVFRYRR